MKSASPLRTRQPAGVTLMELTLVIVVVLTLVTLLTYGARAWRRGADRAACVITIRNVQTSVRSYQNLYGYNPGTMPYAEHGTQSIAEHLHKKGYITDKTHTDIKVSRTCPGQGTYSIPLENVFPSEGELYLNCSLETAQSHNMPGNLAW